MAVYFVEPMERSRDGKTLQCGDRDVLLVSPDVKETLLIGWRRDFSIDPTTRPLPTLVESRSDDIFVVISKIYDNDGFRSERIVVPDNQFANVLHVEERVLMNDLYCDVMVFIARQNDLFCQIGPLARQLHVLLDDRPRKRQFTETCQLPEIIEEFKEERCSSQIERYLSGKHFNDVYWRELRPRW